MDTAQPIVTHYQSSKGPVLIEDMAFPHLNAATAKMEREGQTSDPAYPVMIARRDRLNAEYEAAQAAQAAEAEAGPRLGGIGDNGAPEPTPFELVKAEIEDLRVEAGNWLDGAEVQSQAEADKLGLLLERVRNAAKRADAERVKEKEPHDEAVKQIQDRYNSLIGNTKSVKGVAVRIEEAVKEALGGWLRKVAAEQERQRQEAAQREAEARRQAEEHIAHTHDATDIDDRDAALADVDRARQAAIDLAAANRAKAQAQGETRAIGLRTVYRAEIVSLKDALAHYWRDRPEAFSATVEQFAKDDIRAGKRSDIPGIIIHADQVV
jgi:hypothetical protein